VSQLRTATLTLNIDQEEDALCLVVFGDLDLAGSRALGKVLRRALARHAWVVLDLSGLDFMDSSSVQVLVEADLHARLSGHRFDIFRAPQPVQRVVELSGMSDRLRFAD
jgi:anti-sigma B factor antagonist